MMSLISDEADEYDYNATDDMYDMKRKDDINDNDNDKSIISTVESCKDDGDSHIDKNNTKNISNYDINDNQTYNNSHNLIDVSKYNEYNHINDNDCDYLSTTISDSVTMTPSKVVADDFDDDLTGSSLPSLLSIPFSPFNPKKILNMRSEFETNNIALKKNDIVYENKINLPGSPTFVESKASLHVPYRVDRIKKNKMKLTDYKEIKQNNLNALAEKNKLKNEMQNIFINSNGSMKINKKSLGNDKNKNITSGMLSEKSPTKKVSTYVRENIKIDDNHENQRIGNVYGNKNGNEIEDIEYSFDSSGDNQPNSIILQSIESSKMIKPKSIKSKSTDIETKELKKPILSEKNIDLEVEMEDYDDEEISNTVEDDNEKNILHEVVDIFVEPKNLFAEESEVPTAFSPTLNETGIVSSDVIEDAECVEIKEYEEVGREEEFCLNPRPDVGFFNSFVSISVDCDLIDFGLIIFDDSIDCKIMELADYKEIKQNNLNALAEKKN